MTPRTSIGVREPTRPGADAVGFLILRLGIGAVLVWFGAAELHDPSSWTVFFPHGLDAVRAPLMLVHATFLLVVGGLLIVGLAQRVAAWLAALLLLAVLGALAWNGAFDSVFVRDIGLAAAALGLAAAPSAVLAPGLDRWMAGREGGAGRWAAASTLMLLAVAVVVLSVTAEPQSGNLDRLGGVGGGLFGQAPAGAGAAPASPGVATQAGGTGSGPAVSGLGGAAGPSMGAPSGADAGASSGASAGDVDVGGEDGLGAAPGSALGSAAGGGGARR